MSPLNSFLTISVPFVFCISTYDRNLKVQHILLGIKTRNGETMNIPYSEKLLPSFFPSDVYKTATKPLLCYLIGWFGSCPISPGDSVVFQQALL